MKLILKILFALMALTNQVFADAEAMKAALPAPPDGYKSEIEEETEAHLVDFAWRDGDLPPETSLVLM